LLSLIFGLNLLR